MSNMSDSSKGLVLELTQLLTTKKAHSQTPCVNLIVTFFSAMAQGGGANVSLAQLKRELDSLSHNLLNIDLQMQQVKARSS